MGPVCMATLTLALAADTPAHLRPEPPWLLHSASRCCSPLCNPQSCAVTPETVSSLVSLGCAGGHPPLSLAGSASPFPFLTALLSLLNTLGRIHKGLCGQVSAGGQDCRTVGEGTPWGKEACFVKPSLPSLAGNGWPGSPRRHRSHLPNLNTRTLPQLATVLAAPGLQNYFLRCVSPVAAPHLTSFSAWALRHEYHLQYLALTLAQRAVGAPNPPPHPASLEHVLLLTGHAAPTSLKTCPESVPIGTYSLPHFCSLCPLTPSASSSSFPLFCP